MEVQSIAVTDYSTGSQYTYSGTAGTWQSITAVGGKVNSGGKGVAVQPAVQAPSTGTTNSPMPFQGTHSAKESTAVQPNAGGWSPTTLQTSPTATVTTYPGLPAGWTVTSSGKVVPPSAAPVSEPPCVSHTLSARHANTHTYRSHPRPFRLPRRRWTRSRVLLRLVDLRSSHHLTNKDFLLSSPKHPALQLL